MDEQINGGLVAARILSKMPRANRERIVNAIAKAAPSVLEKIEVNLVELGMLSKTASSTIIKEASKAEVIKMTKTTLFADIPEKRKSEIQAELKTIEQATPAELQHSKEKIIELIEELKEEKPPARIIV